MKLDLEKAADSLWATGTHHGWWKVDAKDWRTLDPIGREEFLDIVFGILKAASMAEN